VLRARVGVEGLELEGALALDGVAEPIGVVAVSGLARLFFVDGDKGFQARDGRGHDAVAELELGADDQEGER